MSKQILVLSLISMILAGCGQKSTIANGFKPVSSIKNSIQPESFETTYGDGKHIITPLVLTFGEGYKSSLEGMGLVVGGVATFVGDMFAATTELGLQQVSYTLPIPTIPDDYIKEARIKRVFVYIKPEKAGARNTTWWKRVFFGSRDVNFNFLDKLALRMSSVALEDPDHYESKLLTKNLSKKEFEPLMKVFNSDEQINNSIDPNKAKSAMLVKYEKTKKDLYVRNKDYGRIFIIDTKKPKALKFFLEDHPNLKGYFERMHILDDGLLVEVKKDPIYEEGFKMIMSESEHELENFEVNMIDTCSSSTCLELVVPNINLIPIAGRGNAVKFDALIDVDKVPVSFKVNGFLEFEVRSTLRIR